MLLKICNSFKPVFCNKTAATFLGRESQLMWYSWLGKALHGAIQAVVMVKTKSQFFGEEFSWMGFQTDLPNFPFPQAPSNPIQKWKPFFYSRFSQLDPKQLHRSSQLPLYKDYGASISQSKLVVQENFRIPQRLMLLNLNPRQLLFTMSEPGPWCTNHPMCWC